MDNHGTLYYTYFDECKRNYLTEQIKKHNSDFNFEEYSITSLTFEKTYYETEFEKKWEQFRTKYSIDGKKAMHFVEYKKLLDPKNQTDENICYKTFLDNGVFSIEKLKQFFFDLSEIIEEADFYIVHTDIIWKKQRYLVKRDNKKIREGDLKKLTRIVAPRLLNAVPYRAMRKHLDSLMLTLLKSKVEDNSMIPGGYYLDEELPKKIYTKLRFDADGKEFDARTDLKRAYNHTISMGSDNVREKTASEILDEIRFIRKEEVGHDFIPSHCGLELVDMLCSMISGETRLKEYKKMGLISSDSLLKEGFATDLLFEDGYLIEFKSIIESKIRYQTIEQIHY